VSRRHLAIALGCALGATGAHAQRGGADIALSTPSPVIATMFAKNATMAAAVCADHKLRLWDIAGARLLRTTDVAGREVAITAMSDDGRRMLMGDYHGVLTVWNTASGQGEFEQRFERYLTAAAFSHDGRLLAVATGTPLRVFDVLAKRELYALPGSYGTNMVAFSRDDALLVTGDGDAVRVYDARTGKLVSRNMDLLAAPLAADFTSDGRYVVAAGGDRTVFLIDASTGKTVGRMAKTVDPIFFLGVSPDGRSLAVVTLNADNPQVPAAVVFADLPSLQKKGEWMSPAGVLIPGGAAWTPDGHFVAATPTADALHLRRVR
jgi:WD40 repeat protein